MGPRYTHIDKELLEKMSWIQIDKVSSANSLCIGTTSSDFKLQSVLKLLYPLTRNRLYFGQLHYQSGIRLKSHFLKYLNFAVNLGFIAKMERTELRRFYKITDKGHQLLDMFYIE